MPGTRNRGDVRTRATTKNTVPMSQNKTAKPAVAMKAGPYAVSAFSACAALSHPEPHHHDVAGRGSLGFGGRSRPRSRPDDVQPCPARRKRNVAGGGRPRWRRGATHDAEATAKGSLSRGSATRPRESSHARRPPPRLFSGSPQMPRRCCRTHTSGWSAGGESTDSGSSRVVSRQGGENVDSNQASET